MSAEKIGIGKRIKFFRGHESIPALARRLGVHKNTLARYEREETYPDAAIILGICEIFKTTPNWLLLGVAEPEEGCFLKQFVESVVDTSIKICREGLVPEPKDKESKG